MALNKQVHLYGVDTSYFYNTKERRVHNRLNSMYITRATLKSKIVMSSSRKYKKSNEEDKRVYDKHNERIKIRIKEINKVIKKWKNKMVNLLDHNKKKRRFNDKIIKKSNIISAFDSVLTRTMGCEVGHITKDIMVVQTFYFQVTESIIKNGFLWNGEDYAMLTASAGQIRVKKFVVIKKSVLDNIKLSLTCGLTDEIINNRGGVNTNKYLAYTALSNSATEHWVNFDIDKSIVVDDFETVVDGVVDYIDYETYKIKEKVSMGIPIPHTDGAGIYLPKVSTHNTMVRMPWIKGLLVSFPYDRFIRENLRQYPDARKVKDIYGKEWDIFDDDIQIIFTKSQFKMWKYYDSWEQYKDNFKLYNCQAGTCNEEDEDERQPFARLSYQMLQSITDFTEDEIIKVTQKTVDKITKVGGDKNIMLKIMGADKNSKNKNYYQKSLELYPEILRDVHSREVLKDVRQSLIRDARGGRLFMNAYYTFIAPDVYAFAERLFLGIEKPNGLLNDGEVSCSLFKKVNKLDVLRSPSLYREHAVRENVINKDTSKWFTTNAIYVSSHDLISKLLMFDVDGDQALVVADEVFVNMAERNMKDVVPLHYEMKKAVMQQLSPDTIYDGLTLAFSKNSIGIYSNNITKVWNSDEPNLDVIKLLCMEGNFSIDSAKTLFFIERPENENNLISRYTRTKMPYFFMFVKKDKTEENTEPLNKNSIMGKVNSLIPKDRIDFKETSLAKFDYTMLMRNKGVKIDNLIIDRYKHLNIKAGHFVSKMGDDGKHIPFIYREIREDLFSMGVKQSDVVDMLVAYVYAKKTKHKHTLWSSFGDIIFENIQHNFEKRNLDKTISCDVCGKRVVKDAHTQIYCDACAYNIRLERKRVK